MMGMLTNDQKGNAMRKEFRDSHYGIRMWAAWVFLIVSYQPGIGFRQRTLIVNDEEGDPSSAFIDLIDDAKEQHYDLHPDGAIVYWTADPDTGKRPPPRCANHRWEAMGTEAIACVGFCCRVRKLMTETKGKK